MLSIAAQRLEKEEADSVAAKEAYLNERCPPLDFPSSIEDLQVGQPGLKLNGYCNCDVGVNAPHQYHCTDKVVQDTPRHYVSFIFL